MKKSACALISVFSFFVITYAVGFLPIVSARKIQAEGPVTPVVQLGHVSHFTFSGATTLAISPDDKTIVTGGDDGTIKFWDRRNGLLTNTLRAHLSGVGALAFSPSGEFVASGGNDTKVRLWNARTGQLERTLEGHTTPISCIAFSPDGVFIATGSGSFAEVKGVSDNTIRVWDANSNRSPKVLSGHRERITSIAFNDKGNRLASGSSDKTIRIWSVDAAKELRMINTEANGSVNYSPDGKTIASAGPQRVIFWSADTGEQVRSIEHESYDTQISFTLDWRLMAIGGWEIEIRDVSTGQKIRTLQRSGSSSETTFSNDGLYLIGAGGKGPVTWDVNRGIISNTFGQEPAYTTGIVFNKTGDKIAWARKNTVYIWDATGGKLQSTLNGHEYSVNEVAFSPDGKTLASCSDGEIKLWSAVSGQFLRNVSIINYEVEDEGEGYQSLQFSPDGNVLAVGGSTGETTAVRLWDTHRWRILKVFRGDPPKPTTVGLRAHSLGRPGGPLTEVHSIVFSPDGSLLVAGDDDSNIIIWDVQRGRRQKIIKGHDSGVNSVAFSHDGKRIASGSFDQTVKVWAFPSMQLLSTMDQHHDRVTSVRFSPDDQTIISGSLDQAVRFWDVQGGKAPATLEGHDGAVTFVAFSPGGRVAVSSGVDGRINVWSVPDKALISSIMTFNDNSWINYSPDGFYTGTPGALKYMAWRVGDKIYEGSALRDRLENKELLMARFLGKEPPFIKKPDFSAIEDAGEVTPPSENESKLFREWKDHRFYALVIGNDKYKYLPPLSSAVKDATAVARVLEQKYDFEVKLLTDVTKDEILNELQRYERITTENSSLLIYYAGHGTYLQIGEQKEGNWQPVDADEVNRNNWVKSSDILESIKLMRAAQILVISDSCFSGALFNYRGGPPPVGEELAEVLYNLLKRKSWTLVASGGTEPVSDVGEDGHSIFGRAILKGLRNMSPKVFTMDKLFHDYIDEEVQFGARQTPKIRSIPGFSDEGKFIFMRRGRSR